ncbi:MAG TPA: LamG domain-containing protein [Patescibacteria group bacterium]|nr:LamG domain-containing protein [Patescibacteria group bacterium]
MASSSPLRVRRFRRIILHAIACTFVIAAWGRTRAAPAAAPDSAPGGFLESALTGLVRARLSLPVLQALLPARGPFTFPPPYNTSAVRITNASDCGGADCVDAVGYSYWRNINNHAGSNQMLILLGLNRARGGPGPSLFSYDKTTGAVANLGPLFDPAAGRSWHSTEGWYWSMTKPTKIYVDDASRMERYDVLARQYETVFDVAPQFGADKTVWQMHSSDDDRVHSATLRTNTTWEMLGCVVYHEDTHLFQYFPKIGDFNECSVDKSGRWLMSLENVDGLYDLEMRIFDLSTGTERMVWDQDGAVGHADMGYGYVVGSDNWNALPNAELLWDFARNPLAGQMVSHNLDWSAPAPNHISHANARAGVPAGQQFACGSGATRVNAVWGNEIICFPLDGSLRVLVVAPVMTDLNATGGGTDDYVKMPKGNLDVTGDYFIWTSNAGGNRLDAYVVKIPNQLLFGTTGDTTPPVISAVAGTGITSTGVVMTWLTDEASDSQVEYGPTTSYGSTSTLDATLLASHSVALGGLAPGALCHARVLSRDGAGNLATSGDFTFTTLPPAPPPDTSGPIGAWSFGEGSGSSTVDATGHGLTGALMNGAVWVAGPIGTAAGLDGVDDYVEVQHATALDAYPLTVSVWVRTSTTGLSGVVNKYLPSSFNGYQIFVNGGNLCAWYFKDASNSVWDGTSCSLAAPGRADGQWHHVAFVVDAAGGRLYVDGSLAAARAWSGSPGPASTTASLSFGRYPGIAAPYLPGAIDEVRLYARALSAAEVLALFDARGAGTGGGPKGKGRNR